MTFGHEVLLTLEKVSKYWPVIFTFRIFYMSDTEILLLAFREN